MKPQNQILTHSHSASAEEEAAVIEQLASHYESIIRLLGEDPDREGLRRTPMRAARAMYFCTRGYRQQEEAIVNEAVFEHDGSKMVIVKDIEFYSLCEHHILPFFGNVSIGYIPDGKIIGISKLARLVDHYARRLQVQERLTAEIANSISRLLGCKGVIVACNAQHLCMKMRGVQKQDASTTTVETVGVFDTDTTLQQRFFDALKV